MSSKNKKKSLRNYDYKQAFKRKSDHSLIKKVGMTVIAANLMVGPVGSYISNTGEVSFLPQENVAEAASLAEVQLLTDVNVDATLNEPVAGEPYNLNLNLNGTGLADVELVSPERTVVFHAPDIAGEMVHSGGTASVQVDILPINLQEDLPTLYGLINPLTNTLTTSVSTITSLLAANPLVTLNGIDELNASLDALNNLDVALQDLSSYTDNVEYTVGPDGEVVVSFSDGLGNHLDTAVNDVVLQLLNDVVEAIGNLNASGIGSSVLNPVLSTLSGLVDSTVVPLVNEITSGAVDLTSDLAGVQVIGQTNVNLDVLVNNPSGVSGEVVVQGAGIQDSVIDAALLSSLESSDTIVFDEDAAAPVLESAEIAGDSTDGYTVTGNAQEPGDRVVVTDSDGVEVGTSVVAEDGTYEAPIAPGSVDVGENLGVQAIDEAGNTSETISVTVPDDSDATAPILGSADIDGNSTDGYIVTGDAEEPGDTVIVTDSEGTEVGTGVVAEDGTYEAPIAPGSVDPQEIASSDSAG